MVTLCFGDHVEIRNVTYNYDRREWTSTLRLKGGTRHELDLFSNNKLTHPRQYYFYFIPHYQTLQLVFSQPHHFSEKESIGFPSARSDGISPMCNPRNGPLRIGMFLASYILYWHYARWIYHYTLGFQRIKRVMSKGPTESFFNKIEEVVGGCTAALISINFA